MPRGGARVNSGPARDPNALRRERKDDQQQWTLLPSKGRPGNAPGWPLEKWRELEKARPVEERNDAGARTLDKRELEIWREIWKTPQATAWDRLGWRHDVALYVRLLVQGERGNLKAAGEARQWSDRLGLNQTAMLRNRWKIAADELGARREENSKQTAGARRPSSRDRFSVVPDGTGG
ncbi:hypothetical protein [Zhihengliuella sp.]|uniref:hypothetical protein n=1 Tax=Zhihengliuella sp. TaxID=1954483 RepID=UPI002810FBB4|nr:hypothetical protein [Zhihengliuella sp.]